MINKRFLKKAKEWKNPKVPKPREDKPISNSGLTQILQRGENGKPILDLTPLEKTTVHTPTQESYIELLRVYECGDWKWHESSSPAQLNLSINFPKSFWESYKEETCVDAGVDFRKGGVILNGVFGYRKFDQSDGWKAISTQQFYETQNITTEMLQEINEWLGKHG